jgi:putative acetyltransferase
MQIRLADIKDAEQLLQLFHDTITIINSKDYNEEQIAAWVSSAKNSDRIKSKIKEQYFIVAEIDNEIVGFGSLTVTGYLDCMYVHKDHQRKGIANKLIDEIKRQATKWSLKEITTDASITAKPFFEKNGFKVITQQKVYIIDVMLINYKMHCIINAAGA